MLDVQGVDEADDDDTEDDETEPLHNDTEQSSEFHDDRSHAAHESTTRAD